VAVVSLDLFRQLPVPVPTKVEPVAVVDVEVPGAGAGGGVEAAVTATVSRVHTPRAMLSAYGLYGTTGRGVAAAASIRVWHSFTYFFRGALETESGANDLSARHVPLCAGLGGRTHIGRLAFASYLGFVVATHKVAVDDGTRRVAHTKTRGGGFAELSLAVRAVGPIYATLTAHFDGYKRRQRYQVGGEDVYETSWYDASINLGLSWAIGASR
jgi:hypothetical protein